MADPAIQYIDNGPDTSVPAKPGAQTGPADAASAIPDYGSSSIPGYDPAKSAQVTDALAGIERGKIHELSVLDQREMTRVEYDRRNMQNAYSRETYAADDPALHRTWDADKERAARIRTPLEDFGSFATIFALAASGFTRTPMISALNASAASMNAMRANDEQGYAAAEKAYKDNAELAFKRFNMERNLFEDANKLISTDVNLWQTKRAAVAAQFDDKKTLALMEAGMAPEVIKLDAQRVETTLKAQQAFQADQDIKRMASIGQQEFAEWQGAHPPSTGDWKTAPPEEQLARWKAYNEAMNNARKQVEESKRTYGRGAGNLTPAQTFTQKWWAEHPEGTDEEFGEAFGAFMRGQKYPPGGRTGTPSREGSPTDDNARIDADIRKEHPDWGDTQVIEERNRRIKKSKEGTKPSLAGEHAQQLADNKKAVREEHPYWTDAQVDNEAERRVNAAKGVTPNRADEIKTQQGRIDEATKVIDRVEQAVKTHTGITGLAGKVNRPLEIVKDIFGSNQVAYKRFESDINLLKDWWAQNLENNRVSGRHLSAQETRLGSIIPGLSVGDTSQHTIDQLRQVKEILSDWKKVNNERLGGSPTASSPIPTTPPKKRSWDDDPVSP